jgi:hypothetical protein
MKASQGPIGDILKLAEWTQIDKVPLIGQPYLPLHHEIESSSQVHCWMGLKYLRRKRLIIDLLILKVLFSHAAVIVGITLRCPYSRWLS